MKIEHLDYIFILVLFLHNFLVLVLDSAHLQNIIIFRFLDFTIVIAHVLLECRTTHCPFFLNQFFSLFESGSENMPEGLHRKEPTSFILGARSE